jgi:hypothetical protein
MRPEAEFHTIIAAQVAAPSRRNEVTTARLTRELHQVLTATLEAQGVDPSHLHQIDQGDSVFYLMPAEFAPRAAIDPLVRDLGTELRMHRETSSPAHRLRLQVAVNTGMLHHEPSGAYSGTPLVECARLLDAAVGREMLTEHPEADLVLLLTDTVYRDVVASGSSLSPGVFQPIEFSTKETRRTAWAYLPGVVPKPGPGPRRSDVSYDVGGHHLGGSVIGEAAGPPPGPEFPTDR